MKEGQYVPPICLSEVAGLPVWIVLHALHLCLLISGRFTYWYLSIFPSLTTPPSGVGWWRNWWFSCSSQVLLLTYIICGSFKRVFVMNTVLQFVFGQLQVICTIIILWDGAVDRILSLCRPVCFSGWLTHIWMRAFLM